jgi:alanine racemase
MRQYKNKRFTKININLANLDSNIQLLKSYLKSGDTKIMAVVKSNAYGHGLVEVSKQAVESGVYGLGVSLVQDGLELRRAGITAPIYILGEPPVEIIGDALKNNFILCINSYDKAKIVSQKCVHSDKTLKIHIKIDTGMNRLGISYLEAIDEIEKIRTLPNLIIEGVFTHFSCAGEKNESYTRMQWERFQKIIELLKNKNINVKFVHCANSAAFLRSKDFHLDMVRLGISIYGCSPFNVDCGSWLKPETLSLITRLKPVLSLISKISFIKNVSEGECISYGAAFKTRRSSVIATIPIGYADGYTRMLSGKSGVLINGDFAPVVGNITMDQILVDATEAAQNNIIKAGSSVILIGNLGNNSISADWLASRIGTINYEILCMLKDTIPRIYIK